jgi:hypothetical protein
MRRIIIFHNLTQLEFLKHSEYPGQITHTSSTPSRQMNVTEKLDRAISQAASRCLPTAAARVRALLGHVGFVGDKVALGQFFSAYLGFLCQSSFHQILHPHNHPGQVCMYV